MLKFKNKNKIIKPNDICSFPKHKGKKFIDVFLEDRSYLEWLVSKNIITYKLDDFNKIVIAKNTNDQVTNLTPEQLIVSDNIIKEIRKQALYSKYRSIVIDAESGSGKSHTLVQTISRIPIKELLECYNMYALGPTNNAVDLLKNKIKSIGDSVKIMTIHRCLKMMKKYNDDGLIYFTPESSFISEVSRITNDKSKVNIFFIDESSMIPDTIYNYLREINGLFIYFGDIKQLPPIEESIDFSTGISKTLIESNIKYSLSQIVRAKNENILNIHKSFRSGENIIVENDNVKICKNDYDFYSIFVNLVKIDKLSCILTYTNKRVREHSVNIRELLGFTEPFVKNELLRCNTYYDSMNIGSLHNLGYIFEFDPNLEFEESSESEYYNTEKLIWKQNSIGRDDISEKAKDCISYGLKKFELLPTKQQTASIVNVTDYRQTDLLFIFKSPCSDMAEKHFCIRFYLIGVINDKSENGCISILEQSVKNIEMWNGLLEHWNKMLKIVFENKIKWQLYYNVLEMDAPFTHTYSMTIHKAQGSTIKNAFIDINDINKMEDNIMKQHLLYTAVTRTSDNIYFNT
jgi:hypothetical protein